MAHDIKRRIARLERLLEEKHQTPVPPTHHSTPLHSVQNAWKEATVEDRMKIISWIQDQLQADPDLSERFP